MNKDKFESPMNEPAADPAAGAEKVVEPTEARTEEQSALDTLQKQLAEANDKFLRAKAEHENYRKRVQREFGEIRQTTKLLTVSDFLSVYDHFQMAMSHDQTADYEALKTGMKMIQSEFNKALENLGIETINAEGQVFDPNEHEAVAQEASDTVPAGQVLNQWKSGYRMSGKLIRPASVVVSSGPAVTPRPDDTATE